jgi:hypothetical protein
MNSSDSSIRGKSGLPSLELGSSDDVLALLDSLYRDGGLQAVADWTRRELQPGRQISYRGRRGAEVETAIVYDRSLWRLEAGQPHGEPVVPPVTDEKFGESELFAIWSRPLAKEPFALRLRTSKS